MTRITFRGQSGPRAALAALAAVLLLGAAEPAATPSREDLAKNNKMFLQGAIKALKWEQPAEPLKIVGPIYFVGTQGLGSYLFNTSEGLILMGTGTPASGPMIAASIRKLGFRPEDIKVIVTWHAHADHAGAIAYFKQLSGAQLAVMEGDVAAMEDGGKSDFHYGWDWKTMGWPPANVDRVLHDGDEVTLGDVTLDRESHRVTAGGQEIALTHMEFELLAFLMAHAGKAVTREVLLDDVWGIAYSGDTRTIDVHVRTLRQKLGDSGRLIATIRNVGYRMDEHPEAGES